MSATSLDRISPRTLRELASLMESQDPARQGRLVLTDAGVQRLAEILMHKPMAVGMTKSGRTVMASDRPTIGFYLNPTYRTRSPL